MVSYLGRYTHRVAIGNNRIMSVGHEAVHFKWKDYRDNQMKTMSLEPLCFIRRFLQHILPDGFYKIRYFGIFASANSKTKLCRCFSLMRTAPGVSIYQGLPMQEVLRMVTGKDITRCPLCKAGRMVAGIREALMENEHT